MLKSWWPLVGVLSLFVAVASSAGCGNPGWSCEQRTDAGVQVANLCVAQQPKYEVPTKFSQFTTEPQSGVYLESNFHENTILLYCNVSDASIDGFVWEHNGDVVEDSSLFTITGAGPLSTASVLTISGFSQTTHSWQGDYRCIVQNGNFTLASKTAHLEAPQFHNWIDEAYPAQPDQDHVTFHVRNGAAVILECQANTTNKISKVVWSRNRIDLGDSDSISLKDHYGLPSGSLLVRDVSLAVGKDLVYECQVILAQPSGEKSRSFTLSLQSEGVQEAGLISVRPVEHKEALEGSNVELYCLSGHPNPQPEVVWYKEGTSVDKLKTVGGGEVLWIENISVDTAGVYTCSVSSGNVTENSTANVVIIEPHTIATLSLTGIEGDNGYQYDTDIFIPVDRGNISFHVTCHTDRSYSGANEEYVWLFRGKPVAPPLFTQSGNTLVVQAPSAWDVVGSLQCIVSSLAGSLGTSVRILIKDKPNPPTNLWLRRDEEYSYQFELNWHAPASIANQTLTKYTAEVFILSNYNIVCSLNLAPEHSFATFLANDYHLPRTNLYFVLSSSTFTGQSDFICKRQTMEPVPPPQVDLFNTLTRSGHQWNVALRWVSQVDECHYPANYNTNLNLECDGVKLLSDEPIKSSNSVGSYEKLTPIPCSSSCDWSVKMTPYEDYDETYTTTSESQHLKTGPLVPSKPPTLERVDRSNSDGKSVIATFTIPEASSSCNPHYLVLRYSNGSGVVGTENMTFGEYDRTRKLYNQTATLRNAQCWQQYDVSIAYGNTMGQSEFSNNYALRGPREGDVKGFTSVTSNPVNSTAITVHWGLGDGVGCLLSMGFISGRVCYAESSGECREVAATKGCLSLTKNDLTFGRLRPHTRYCFNAEILYARDDGSSASMNSITAALTNEAIPTGKPRNLELSRSTSGEVFITWNPPLNTTLNGILTQYRITVAISNRTTINHNLKSMDCTTSGCFWKTPPIDAYLKCQVKVSACTSVGCGPAANQTSEPDGSATPPTAEPDSTSSSSDSKVSTVVIVIVVAVVAIIALIVLVVVVKCRCRSCRKHNGETQEQSHQGRGSWERLEQRPPQEAVPTTSEFPVLRDEPIRQDDLISVGKPAPSIATERTECHPLMDQYLKDCEEYSVPDGEAEHTLPPEMQRETVNTAPDSYLLGTTPNQGKIMELNDPSGTTKRAKMEGSEKVEPESFPLQYVLADELKSEEHVPLLSSRVTGKGFAAKEQAPSKSQRWRGLFTLGKKEKSPNNAPPGQLSSARNDPLGKPPSPQQPSIPGIFARNDGYMSEEAVRRANSHPALETELEQPLVKPGPQYVSRSPEAGLENQALSACKSISESKPQANRPVGGQFTGVHSHFHAPPFGPADNTFAPTVSIRPSYVQTGMNASGYVQQGVPERPVNDFTGDLWDMPSSPAMHQLWPSSQHEDMGYVQNDQNTKSRLVEEDWSFVKGGDASELELLSQPDSNASSLVSSVFEGPHPVGDSYLAFPPTVSRVLQRNRSAMTSGVFSQSEQIATSGSAEPKDGFIGFCETTDNSGTKTSTSSFRRMASEGYVSQPSTPGIKDVDDFGFQQPANTTQPKFSAAPTCSAAVDLTEYGSERNQVGRRPTYVGHHPSSPTSLQSFKTTSKLVGQGKEIPRSSLSSGPSIVTCLYRGNTVANLSDGLGNLKEHSTNSSTPPSPVAAQDPLSPHSNASSFGMTAVTTNGSSIISFSSPVGSAHAYLSSADLPTVSRSIQQSSPHPQPATRPHELGASSTRSVEDPRSSCLADGYVCADEDQSGPPGGHGTIRKPQYPSRPSAVNSPPVSPRYTLPTLLLVPSSQAASRTSPGSLEETAPIRATTEVRLQQHEKNLPSAGLLHPVGGASARPPTGYV